MKSVDGMVANGSAGREQLRAVTRKQSCPSLPRNLSVHKAYNKVQQGHILKRTEVSRSVKSLPGVQTTP